jgi:Co/Zn/Cd efflux system component
MPPWLLKLGMVLTFSTGALGILLWQLSGSVAVLGDALHSFFHCALWFIAFLLNTHHNLRTKARHEMLMGFVISGIGLYIAAAGVMNIITPAKTVSWQMIIVACIALTSEFLQAKLMYSVLYKGEHIRGIHAIKILLRDTWIDIFASLGVLTAGAVILTMQFERADGIAAIPIALAALFFGLVTIAESYEELQAFKSN